MNCTLIIDIKVTDLERAKLFYQEILGFTLRRYEIEQGWCAFTVGNAEIHLYTQSGVRGHVEFYVTNIQAEVDSLKKKGVDFVSGITKPNAQDFIDDAITVFPWGKIAFFVDSEGNELALVQDNIAQ